MGSDCYYIKRRDIEEHEINNLFIDSFSQSFNTPTACQPGGHRGSEGWDSAVKKEECGVCK